MIPTSLRKLAAEFREAIERCERRALPIGLQDFPRGSCGDATLLLGTHMAEIGEGTFAYVMGERGEGPDWTSHAWLERGGLVIDITADQFPEVTSQVIVTDDSPWHRTFEVQHRQPSDFRGYDAMTVAILGAAYRMIQRELGRAGR